MNYTTAVMLFNENIRAISVVYEDTKEAPGLKTWVFKTLDQSIKKDDILVVSSSTRHGLTTVKAIETDVEVDFDSEIQLKWIIQKVDTATYDKILEEEKVWIDTMKQAELKKKREDIRSNITNLYADPKLETLAISSFKAINTPESAIESDKKDVETVF